MMYYESIINGINNAIESIAGVPVLFKENKQNKPADVLTPWMRTTLLPSEPMEVTIGYDRQLRYTGIVQLDYFVPLNYGSTITDVDTIVNWFNNKDNRFININDIEFIVLSSWRGTSIPGDKWYSTPIYIRVQWYDGQI